MYLIFLRCRYCDISTSSDFLVCSAIIFCFTSFRSYRIRIQFSFSYFYFYRKINNFFYSSVLFACSSASIALILSCHTFSPYFFYCSSFLISSSNQLIIQFEIMSLFALLTFLVAFSFIPLFIAILFSNSRTFCFFITQLLWQAISFLRTYLTLSIIFFVYSFTFKVYLCVWSIFYLNYSSFFIILIAFACPFFILTNPSFYSSRSLRVIFRSFSLSSFCWTTSLLKTLSSCLFN